MHYIYAIINSSFIGANKAVVLMVFGGFAFATMGALTHKLGESTDWVIIAFFRMFFTFLFISAILIRSGKFPFVFNRPLLWFRSFVGSVAMLATFYALTRLPISDVAVITETRPIWVALLAAVFIGENTHQRIWLSIIFCMLGVIIIEQPFMAEKNYDVFIVLLASMLGAVVMICLRMLRYMDPRLIVAHFSATASVVCLIYLFVFRNYSFNVIYFDWPTVIMLLGVGLFGTFGQLAMTRAFALGEAPTVATAGFIKVGFSAMYDILIWKYVFSFSTVFGMILILGSTMLLFNIKLFRLSNRVMDGS